MAIKNCHLLHCEKRIKITGSFNRHYFIIWYIILRNTNGVDFFKEIFLLKHIVVFEMYNIFIIFK
jgi:hypothetical protein